MVGCVLPRMYADRRVVLVAVGWRGGGFCLLQSASRQIGSATRRARLWLLASRLCEVCQVLTLWQVMRQ